MEQGTLNRKVKKQNYRFIPDLAFKRRKKLIGSSIVTLIKCKIHDKAGTSFSMDYPFIQNTPSGITYSILRYE